MANPPDTPSMALFCDFENVALGVRDAKYDKFDIRKVLERLLLKGSIVVKKAYCDWERYREFKAPMHEASFELIEIPHVRQSGKNSADIRMVVDALDLCYTKSHVDTFVIISGDSDFSPLVSKLRENNKTVIGVGVKGSTSDLLTANCDEFIFYDDLVREQRRRGAQHAARRDPGRETNRDANRDGARDGSRDGGRDAGRDPGRDGARNGGSRSPARGAEREPLRSVPAGPLAPPAGSPAPAEDTVGGPWRRHGSEPREQPAWRETARDGTAEAANEGTRIADDGPDGDAGERVAETTPADADAHPVPAGDAPGPDDAAPAAPARRSRRGRSRGTSELLIGLDGDAATTAADIAAADLAGTDAAPTGGDPHPDPDLPKKRAPRRRKAVAGDAPIDQAAPDAAPDASPVAAAGSDDGAGDPGPGPDADSDPEADTDPERGPEPHSRPHRTDAERRQEAIDLAVETVEALITERGADDKIWGSMVKQTLKRRRPGFAESYYGYRSFNELLEDARDRGLLALDHDEKSGGYVIRLL